MSLKKGSLAAVSTFWRPIVANDGSSISKSGPSAAISAETASTLSFKVGLQKC